ncbi:MAG: DNA replication/repair protein RecF [Rhodospirillales bacterium]|nr:MAG: DNA replication/repair protein RecF [Rhodospirillales bacterium]
MFTAPAVSVSRLTLTEFRCFPQLRIVVGPEPVVLTGPNGSGKTTVVEALSFLAPGRGLRRARIDEVARWRGDGTAPVPWGVAVRLRTADGLAEIGTGRDIAALGTTARERRVIRIDGQPARGQGALAAVLGVAWLTPEMDRLFVEGASVRRRFLDRLAFGMEPAHADRVGAYERAMRERGRLLRQRGHDPTWVAALEDAMARHGVAVAAARREAADRLTMIAGCVRGPFPAATVSLEGAVDGWLDRQPALACEDMLRGTLARGRAADAETGGACAGPHRSDVIVRDAATGRAAGLCSTGEQKVLLLAVVLAGVRAQAAARGSLPLLLLDEVAAHLDARHRSALFELVGALGVQAWYTGTDQSLFDPVSGKARFLTVDAGRVTPSDDGR